MLKGSRKAQLRARTVHVEGPQWCSLIYRENILFAEPVHLIEKSYYYKYCSSIYNKKKNTIKSLIRRQAQLAFARLYTPLAIAADASTAFRVD